MARKAPLSDKQKAVLAAGRAKLQDKHATTKAQRAGADMVKKDPPGKPDTGAIGPDIVDTPYPDDKKRVKSRPVRDKSGTNTAPVEEPPSTGSAPVDDQSTGRGKSSLKNALKIALGLDGDQ